MGLAVLLIASAAAVVTEDDTVLNGEVGACSVGITVPVDSTITLERGTDNIQEIGQVHVISPCEINTWFSVTSTEPSMTNGEDNLDAPFEIRVSKWDGTTWGPWSEFVAIDEDPTAGTTYNSVGDAIYLIGVKQPVSEDDPAGDYTITLDFHLYQIDPMTEPPSHP